ncbi:MAG: hypothetical protein DMD46_05140 [Gemmatimonadetes bacterium]|nr:MAG: hypothetical protein DMD46_05140 [Gemmatimonadota bacterium]
MRLNLPVSVLGALLQLLPASAGAQMLSQDQRILLAGSGQRWVVPRHLVTQVDSSRGEHGHALLGLAVGGAVAFVVGAILFSPDSNACTGSGDYAENCRLYRAGIVVGGAGLGALVGALIRTEQWAPVPLDALRFRGTTN